jgi:hypothetical protein
MKKTKKNIMGDEQAQVGIFWLVDKEILTDAVCLSRAEPYGEALQYGGHYEFWDSLKPKTATQQRFKARAYDAYPRGRVVYFPKKKAFVIYADTCLIREDINAVARHFKIENLQFKIQTDEHYQCAGCNPYYAD